MGFYIYQKRPYPMRRAANYPLRRRTDSEGETGCDERDLSESSPKRKPSQLSVSDIFFDGVLMVTCLTSPAFRLGLKICFRKVLDDEVFSEEGSHDSERCEFPVDCSV